MDPKSDASPRLTSQHVCRRMSTGAIQSLYELRHKKLLCDAVLWLEDGGSFSVHRVILSSCSVYFRFVGFLTLLGHDRTSGRSKRK
jgi:hypothetical protein